MARRKLSGTLTIRLDSKAAQALKRKAAAEKKSTSEVVRSLIVSDVSADYSTEPTALEKSRRFVGALRSGPAANARGERDVLSSWNPDRRG